MIHHRASQPRLTPAERRRKSPAASVRPEADPIGRLAVPLEQAGLPAMITGATARTT
jgi:hypothetical protein